MTFKSEHLYFIAIVPPGDISGQITALKLYMSEKFDTKHALRSPPHITLHMPFKWKPSKQKALEQALLQLSESIQPFTVRLNNFGCFPPRVVFVSVTASQQLTRCFEKTERTMRSLNILNANYKGKPFQPHVTIAFRDLKKEKFKQAWLEVQTKAFKEDFMADALVLLEHFQPEKGTPYWEFVKRYPFGG